MSTKKQKIADIVDAIAQIKVYQSQDSGKNPILKEIYEEWLNKLFNKLYEMQRAVNLKKPKKTSMVKSRESKNQGPAGDQIGNLK